MAVPRANLPGPFNSGVVSEPMRPIDIAGAIAALTGGASSLIHNAYLRKVGEQNRRAAEAQRAFENARQVAADTRQATIDKETRADKDRDHALKVEEQRQKALQAGITPATTVVPAGETTVAQGQSPTLAPGAATLDPAAEPAAPVAVQRPSPLRTPRSAAVVAEHYDPANDVQLQRSLKLRAVPPGRAAVDTPGTAEHTAAVTADADARAKATAKYRAPRTNTEKASQRIAIRQSVQQARAKYIAGDKDFMGNVSGRLDPLAANVRALQEAAEVYGEDAVHDAFGTKGITPVTSKTPAPKAGALPRIATPGAPAAPATPGNVDRVVQAIRANTAKIEDIDTSTRLSAEEKAAIHAALGTKKP